MSEDTSHEPTGDAGPAGYDAPGSAAIDEATGRPFQPTPYPRAPGAQPPSRERSVGGLAERSLAAGKTVLVMLSVAALAATGIAWGAANWLRGNTNTGDIISGAPYAREPDAPPPPPADDGAEDILLVGSDSRTDAQGNPLPLKVLKQLRTEAKPGVSTDTIIVLRIPHDGGKAHAVSIPRDTYVNIPGKGNDKINSAYEFAKSRAQGRLRARGVTDGRKVAQQARNAGAHKLVQTVEQLTDVRIDHYAEVNLLGFYLLSKAVGGVPVCLRAPTRDKDSGADFDAGWQTVKGGEALSFVRQRKNLRHGDLDRIVRQQAFLASAANKVLSAGTLTSPGKLHDLVDTVRRSMLLDKDLDILKFAQQAQNIAAGNVKFVTIPVTDIAARDYRGQSIVTVDKQRVRQYVASLVTDHPRPDPPVPQGDRVPHAAPAPAAPGGTAPGGTAPASVGAAPVGSASVGPARTGVDLNDPKCVY